MAFVANEKIYRVQMYYLQLAYLAEVIVNPALFTSKIRLGLINPPPKRVVQRPPQVRAGLWPAPLIAFNRLIIDIPMILYPPNMQNILNLDPIPNLPPAAILANLMPIRVLDTYQPDHIPDSNLSGPVLVSHHRHRYY